ncbi:MAG: tRNA (adenosine(37)-N6)-threonylcarbamoyltransferase complex transferase subunit TsaD [Candidatus Buchananbacteria bacterium]
MANKQAKEFVVLGIESSCDETSVAVLVVKNKQFFIKSNIVSSQIKIHAPFGGVVPEIAARHHVQNFLPVLKEALAQAQYSPKKIDLIAVTSGPGLITSLLVGAQAAKTLSYAWQKPLIGVNHIKAHISANFLQPVKFPAIALIVSGGHTELILVKSRQNFKKVGQTRDDAAGEAFDKVAKILGLGYPGGPIVSEQALNGNRSAFNFPRPMLQDNNLDFSFSGLKTSVLYLVNKEPLSSQLVNGQSKNQLIADLCASFQQAAVDVLVGKTIKAALKYRAKAVILAGGVAANKSLRQQLGEAVAQKLTAQYLVPEFSLCTDNAAMIAIAGYEEYQKTSINKLKTTWQNLVVEANWEIPSL